MFKKGDVVKCIGRQQDGDDKFLSKDRYFIIDSISYGSLALVGVKGLPGYPEIFGPGAFVLINPESLSLLERALYEV